MTPAKISGGGVISSSENIGVKMAQSNGSIYRYRSTRTRRGISSRQRVRVAAGEKLIHRRRKQQRKAAASAASKKAINEAAWRSESGVAKINGAAASEHHQRIGGIMKRQHVAALAKHVSRQRRRKRRSGSEA